MVKNIMIQGTMSNAGKSLLVAGLCRILKQDGYRVAPFKSQNMALNSYITKEGLEMGRAQVMQAEAAGIEPSVLMNPILLKPTNDVGSQVIVNGEVLGNMSARDYFQYKKKLVPDILKAYRKLEEEADVIVIEGAGSPAEINLKSDDIVNMGLAELVDAPVLLVGDIDRGGVFAQLIGTLILLEEKELARVKGTIINKFRGDKTILESGIDMLEEKSKVPVVGVVPYMNISVEDEDSLTTKFKKKEQGAIDIAVIRFPRISNFTDFDVFEQMEGVSVRYISNVMELKNPDMILLPGTKNTIGDLKWMRQNGLETAIKKRAKDCLIFGICGGYQMLGMEILDPAGVEEGGTIRGMELLPMKTILEKEKIRTQVTGRFGEIKGILKELSGMELCGYEIHMGRSEASETMSQENLGDEMKKEIVGGKVSRALCCITDQQTKEAKVDGLYQNQIYGSYVHGIFDASNIATTIIKELAKRKGIDWEAYESFDYAAFKESQYDLLADTMRKHLDMEKIYQVIGIERRK